MTIERKKQYENDLRDAGYSRNDTIRHIEETEDAILLLQRCDSKWTPNKAEAVLRLYWHFGKVSPDEWVIRLDRIIRTISDSTFDDVPSVTHA